jgi:hypothetical protein
MNNAVDAELAQPKSKGGRTVANGSLWKLA